MKAWRGTILTILLLLAVSGLRSWGDDEAQQAARALFAQAVESQDVRIQIALYQAAVKLDPLYRNAWYNLANAYWDNGQLDEAVEAFQKAIEIDPEYLNAHWNLAIVLQKQGKIPESLAQWRSALDLATDPKDREMIQTHIRYLEELWADEERRAAMQAQFRGAIYLKDGDLYLAELADPAHTEKQLTEFGDISFARVSPGGTLVACLRGRQRLITYDLLLSRVRDHAVEARGPIIDLAWSPSHPDRLAFIRTSRETPGPDGDIFILDVRLDDLTQVTTDGYNRGLAWAPSGEHLAVIKDGPEGERSLVVLSLADQTERLLAPAVPGFHIHRPRWSPNGRHIAFLRISAQGEASLSLVGADGSNLKDAIAPVRETDFQWSADGNRVILQISASREAEPIWAYDLTTGQSQPVLSLPGVWEVAVSPNLPLALASSLPSSPEAAVAESKIWIVDFSTGERKPLVALQEDTYAYDLEWDATGRSFGLILARQQTDRTYDVLLLQADPESPDPRYLAAGIKPQRGSPLLLGLVGKSPEHPPTAAPSTEAGF